MSIKLTPEDFEIAIGALCVTNNLLRERIEKLENENRALKHLQLNDQAAARMLASVIEFGKSRDVAKMRVVA